MPTGRNHVPRSEDFLRSAAAPPMQRPNTRPRCGSARNTRLQPSTSPIFTGGLGREADGESVLRSALAASPQDAGLHHALGLTLVRLKRTDEALEELRRAAELEPGQARYAYVYAVGLHSAAHVNDALAVLKGGLARHPDDRDTLQALMMFSRDSGDVSSALEYAEHLARITPTDAGLTGLIQELRRQAKTPTTP